MRLALINGGIVQNIISAELAFAQTLGYEQVVEATDGAYLGGQYVDGAFVPPAAPPASAEPQTTTVLSKVTFLRRLTQAERIAIRAARASDPVIEDAEQLMSLADNIDVTDPDTVTYVHYLADNGYLAADRPADILAPEPLS